MPDLEVEVRDVLKFVHGVVCDNAEKLIGERLIDGVGRTTIGPNLALGAFEIEMSNGQMFRVQVTESRR